MSDGSQTRHELQGLSVSTATPSADGKGVWVCDNSTLRRIELPESKAK